MVAKIFLSTSFLISRLAFTPNFSESSLTVMPSEIVISRSIGGGAAGSSLRSRTGRSLPSISNSRSRTRTRRRPWSRRPASVGATGGISSGTGVVG